MLIALPTSSRLMFSAMHRLEEAPLGAVHLDGIFAYTGYSAAIGFDGSPQRGAVKVVVNERRHAQEAAL